MTNGEFAWAFAELTEEGVRGWAFPVSCVILAAKSFDGVSYYIRPSVWKYPPAGVSRVQFRNNYYLTDSTLPIDTFSTSYGYSPSLWLWSWSGTEPSVGAVTDFPNLFSVNPAFVGIADDLSVSPDKLFLGGGELVYAPVGEPIVEVVVLPDAPSVVDPTVVVSTTQDVVPLMDTLSVQIADLREVLIAMANSSAAQTSRVSAILEEIVRTKANLFIECG